MDELVDETGSEAGAGVLNENPPEPPLPPPNPPNADVDAGAADLTSPAPAADPNADAGASAPKENAGGLSLAPFSVFLSGVEPNVKPEDGVGVGVAPPCPPNPNENCLLPAGLVFAPPNDN